MTAALPMPIRTPRAAPTMRHPDRESTGSADLAAIVLTVESVAARGRARSARCGARQAGPAGRACELGGYGGRAPTWASTPSWWTTALIASLTVTNPSIVVVGEIDVEASPELLADLDNRDRVDAEVLELARPVGQRQAHIPAPWPGCRRVRCVRRWELAHHESMSRVEGHVTILIGVHRCGCTPVTVGLSDGDARRGPVRHGSRLPSRVPHLGFRPGVCCCCTVWAATRRRGSTSFRRCRSSSPSSRPTCWATASPTSPTPTTRSAATPTACATC